VVLAAGSSDHRELGFGEWERSNVLIVLAHHPNPICSTLRATVSLAWIMFCRHPGRPADHLPSRSCWSVLLQGLHQIDMQAGTSVVAAGAGVGG